MRLKHLWNEGRQWLVRGLEAVETRVKTWTQPAPDRPVKGVVTDFFRSRKDLIAENAFLRQQVIILHRQKGGRVELTAHDHRVLVLLAHRVWGVERCSACRPTRHLAALAPAGLQAVLAAEIEGNRTPTTDNRRHDRLGQGDSRRESAVGVTSYSR